MEIILEHFLGFETHNRSFLLPWLAWILFSTALSITLSSVLIFNAITVTNVKSETELGLPANVTIALLLLVKSGFYGYVWLKLLELYKELGQVSATTAAKAEPDRQTTTPRPQTTFANKSQVQFPRLPSRSQLQLPQTTTSGEHPPLYLKVNVWTAITIIHEKVEKNNKYNCLRKANSKWIFRDFNAWIWNNIYKNIKWRFKFYYWFMLTTSVKCKWNIKSIKKNSTNNLLIMQIFNSRAPIKID